MLAYCLKPINSQLVNTAQKARGFFYSASHCMQFVTRCNSHGLSVRLSVRLSVTFRCFVQMNEDTIMRFSLSGSTIILLSGEVKFIRKFIGDHLQRGRQSEVVDCRKQFDQ